MTTSRLSMAILIAVLTACVAVQRMDAQTPGSATKPSMTAKLIDAEKKADGRGATVEVTTSGVELVDPAVSMEKAVAGQGHLHYQVDKGPIIATPTAKLSFHELTPGAHTIVVMLAGNDHKPLGPQQQLTVTVPAQTQKASY
jgi:hypothetical protein